MDEGRQDLYIVAKRRSGLKETTNHLPSWQQRRYWHKIRARKYLFPLKYSAFPVTPQEVQIGPQ